MTKKKFAPIEDFKVNACQVSIDEETMTCTVYVDTDGWDSYREAMKDIEYFADGVNDPLAMDIEDRLAEMGLALVYPGVADDETVDFDLERI